MLMLRRRGAGTTMMIPLILTRRIRHVCCCVAQSMKNQAGTRQRSASTNNKVLPKERYKTHFARKRTKIKFALACFVAKQSTRAFSEKEKGGKVNLTTLMNAFSQPFFSLFPPPSILCGRIFIFHLSFSFYRQSNLSGKFHVKKSAYRSWGYPGRVRVTVTVPGT